MGKTMFVGFCIRFLVLVLNHDILEESQCCKQSFPGYMCTVHFLSPVYIYHTRRSVLCLPANNTVYTMTTKLTGCYIWRVMKIDD